jgi:valyl-tRNA synthetase
MSKSKGNVIDPLEWTAKYGTDALRFGLIFNTAPGTDLPLAEDKIKGMKHFANKLWNIARFVITNLESYELGVKNYEWKAITPADAEIIHKLKFAIEESTEGLENFQLHATAQEIYQFVWHNFADIYVEASKAQLANPEQKANTQAILHNSLLIILKLLHPFMPFITEHLWQILTEKKLTSGQLLMVEPWPK